MDDATIKDANENYDDDIDNGSNSQSSLNHSLQLNAKIMKNYLLHGAETHDLLHYSNEFENDQNISATDDKFEKQQQLQQQQEPKDYDDYEMDDHMLEYHSEAAAETLNLLLPELQQTNSLDCGNFSMMDVDEFDTCLSNMFCNDVDDTQLLDGDSQLHTHGHLENNDNLFNDDFQMHYHRNEALNNNNDNIRNDDDNDNYGNIPDLTNLQNNVMAITKYVNIDDNGAQHVAVVDDGGFDHNNSSDSTISNSNSSSSIGRDGSNSGSSRSSGCLSNCGSYNGATFSVAASTTSTLLGTTTATTALNNSNLEVGTPSAMHHNTTDNDGLNCTRNHNVLNVFQ